MFIGTLFLQKNDLVTGEKYLLEAEKYLHQALNYPIKDPGPAHFKYIGSFGVILEGVSTQFSIPDGFDKYEGDYNYRVEANEEMFHLKCTQHEYDTAFIWLEKAFKQSAAEFGNDISTESFEELVFKTYPVLDQARFKALKAKYFPPK